MLDIAVVTEAEIVAEFNQRGYFVYRPPTPPPAIEPPGVAIPLAKYPFKWLLLALGLVMVTLAAD